MVVVPNVVEAENESDLVMSIYWTFSPNVTSEKSLPFLSFDVYFFCKNFLNSLYLYFLGTNIEIPKLRKTATKNIFPPDMLAKW